jgi:hypothetical protein
MLPQVERFYGIWDRDVKEFCYRRVGCNLEIYATVRGLSEEIS